MRRNKRTAAQFQQTRQLSDRMQEVNDQLLAIYDVAEREHRELTDEEQATADRCEREAHNIQQRLNAIARAVAGDNPGIRQEMGEMIRENYLAGVRTEIVFSRDLMMVEDAASGGLVPLNVMDIMPPLEEGMLLHKLGLPMPTGLSGQIVWPVFEMVEAQVMGEGVELADTKIPFSKLTASPERIGVALPLTNQSITQTDGVIELVVRDVLPRAIAKLLNKILLGRRKVNNATSLAGPFTDPVFAPVALSKIPTAKELNLMKARVLETGIQGDNLCWTLTKSLAAILEVTPINPEGVFIPMLQNGRLLGIPVFTSNEMRDVETSYKVYNGSIWADYDFDPKKPPYIEATVSSVEKISKPKAGGVYRINKPIKEYIGLGDWTYQPMGMFGQLRFIVDPYSKSRKDTVDFVINGDYATRTLRPEAFLLGEVDSEDAEP